MNRVTAIICGALLFGLGLFLGMVGSFVRTLAPEAPPPPKIQPRVAIVNPKPGAAQQSPATMESALSEALAMIAVALSPPPDSSPPPASAASADIATNVPELPSLDEFLADAADDTEPMDPLEAAPPPPPPNPLAGHWVFDPRLGWLWLPENTTAVVIVPMIEMFPGGLVMIKPVPKSIRTRKPPAIASRPPLPQLPKNGVIPNTTPGAKESPASPPSQKKSGDR